MPGWFAGLEQRDDYSGLPDGWDISKIIREIIEVCEVIYGLRTEMLKVKDS